MKHLALTLVAATLSWSSALDCVAESLKPAAVQPVAKSAAISAAKTFAANSPVAKTTAPRTSASRKALPAAKSTLEEAGLMEAPVTVYKSNRPATESDDSPVPAGTRVKDFDEIFSDTNESSGALLMRGRAAFKSGNYVKAIALAERGVKMDSDDPDLHLLHAEALEAKLKHQTDKDPALFQKVVEKWLMLYRNQVGEEKGMDIKGISVLHGFYADEERGMTAKRHLLKLTGYVPKMWETNNRYLKRVLTPATTTVTATLHSKTDEQEDQGAKREAGLEKREAGIEKREASLERREANLQKREAKP